MVHLGWPYHSILAPDHLGTGSHHRLSQVDDHSLECGYIVSDASHLTVTRDAWPDRILVAEHQVPPGLCPVEQLLTQLRIAHTVLHRCTTSVVS